MALIPIVLFALILSLLPWVFVGMVLGHRRRLDELNDRLDRLERAVRGAPAARSAQAPTAPAPSALPYAAPPVPAPARPEPPAAPTPAPTPAPAAISRAATSSAPDRLEAQVGGIWMQNVGSVLLLLGAFFLIVWGYANGRVGPGALVLAGVALGLVIAWRGNSIARSLPPLGNALIGVGLGVVYITLYLGHFRMHVLPGWAAFASLVAVALGTVAIGLRRREPIIATLGVAGAYLPQLLAAWIPLHEFALPPPALLAYFAVVNGVVFALASTVGWSGLAILSLALTTATWGANAGGAWGLGIQLGLSALFVALGLAPVVRLARAPGRVPSIDLAVVAAAPMLLLLCSWPFLASPERTRAAALLGGLAAVYAGAALWVDARRRDPDLWRPLTGAAAVLLAAAIERGLEPRHLALAWCAEGATLAWLGLKREGSWLRFLGYFVLTFSALRLLGALFEGTGAPGTAALLGPASLRDLLGVAAFLFLAHLLGSRRERLGPYERYVPGLAVFGSNLLLLVWIGREAGSLRHFVPGLERRGGGAGAPLLAAAGWLLQSFVLTALAARRNAPVLRRAAYAVAGIAALALMVAQTTSDPWRPGDPPLLNAGAIVTGFAAAVLIAMAEVLWRQRERLAAGERRMPEVVAAAANVVLLLAWAREAGHVAWALGPGAGGASAPERTVRTLAAVFTSAGWTLQAIALFAVGWLRESAFLRWSGLVLFGLTVLKFLLVDLDRVDSFWRFVSALGIGAALLMVSFLYQRRARGAAAGGGSP